MSLKLSIIGLPGAGKSTQGKRVADTYDTAYISTGDLCRDNLDYVTVSGQSIGDYLDAGKLPPTDDVAALLSREVAELPDDTGYVIDGFPRTAEQVPMLNDVAPVDALLYIDIDVEDAVDRLLARGRSDDTQQQIANRMQEQRAALDPLLSAVQDIPGLDLITVYDDAAADTPAAGIDMVWTDVRAALERYDREET